MSTVIPPPPAPSLSTLAAAVTTTLATTVLQQPPPGAHPLLNGSSSSSIGGGGGGDGDVTTTGRDVTGATEPPKQYWFIPGYSAANYTERATVQSPSFNGTGGFFVDEESGDSGLSDLQTLFLACFATLVPLLAAVVTVVGIRILWRRYKRRASSCQNYDGVLESSENVEKPLHSHLLNCEKKCTDAHFNVDGGEFCDGNSMANGSQLVKGNNHSSTNGSIITMTLKNNHLIVETEERNDLEEDSRETTMKYSPSARDGVFVVEVQQGVRRSPTSGSAGAEKNNISDQCALVHKPPDRFTAEDSTTAPLDKTAPIPLPIQIASTTGLTQSNQSLTSTSYTYGNQQEYNNGVFGYPVYTGYPLNDGNNQPGSAIAISPISDPTVNNSQLTTSTNNEETSRSNNRLKTTEKEKSPLVTRQTLLQGGYKPKITAAIYKSSSSRGGSLDLLAEGPLLSDVRLGVSTGGGGGEEMDSIQAEQNLLGNFKK